MLDSLDFTLPPASTACVDRRQHVRAYPTSASTLSPTGTRTVRLRLGGDDFIDPHSIRVMYTIKETGGANPLICLTGPWGAWSQVYLRSNGVELDNIPQYGRFHQQYGWNQLSMHEQFGEAAICGLNGSWGTRHQQPAASGVRPDQRILHGHTQDAPLPLLERQAPAHPLCAAGARNDLEFSDLRLACKHGVAGV